MSPGLESHAGAAFCGIASLVLSDSLHFVYPDSDGTELTRSRDPDARSSFLRWLVFRQQQGFQGRCNKRADSCYSFWNGATLDLFQHHDLVHVEKMRAFVLSCECTQGGGFPKFPDHACRADVLHSYYSLAGLDNLCTLDTALQIPRIPDHRHDENLVKDISSSAWSI